MKKTFVVLAITLLFAGCNKETETPAPKAPEVQPELKACCWISTTNQVNDVIECYDQNVSTWGTPAWSWKPTTALGFDAGTELNLWGDPTDVKLRDNTAFGGSRIVAVTSYRFATVIDYTTKMKKWFQGMGVGSYLHAIEVLPNGVIIVASSGKDGESDPWIRMYSPTNPGYRVDKK